MNEDICLECFERPVWNQTRGFCRLCYGRWYRRMGGDLLSFGYGQGPVRSGTRLSATSNTVPSMAKAWKDKKRGTIDLNLGCIWCQGMYEVSYQTMREIARRTQYGCHKACQEKPIGFDRSSPRDQAKAPLKVRPLGWASCLVNDCRTVYYTRGIWVKCSAHTSNEANSWRLTERYRLDSEFRTAIIVRSQSTRAARGGNTSNQIACRWLDRLEYYGHRCYLCGIEVEAGVNMEWEHVKPKSKGGHPWLPCNIRPACVQCNRKKHNAWI